MRWNVAFKVMMGLMVFLGIAGCGGGGGSSDHRPPVSGGTETWRVVQSPIGTPSDWNFIDISGGTTTGSIRITKSSSKLTLSSVSLYGNSSVVISPVWSFFFAENADLLHFPITVGEKWTSEGYSGKSTTEVLSKSDTVTNLKGITAINCAHTRETSAFDSTMTTSNTWNTVIDKWICPGYGPFKFVTTWNAGQVSTNYLDIFTPSGTIDPNDYWPMNIGNTWVMKN